MNLFLKENKPVAQQGFRLPDVVEGDTETGSGKPTAQTTCSCSRGSKRVGQIASVIAAAL